MVSMASMIFKIKESEDGLYINLGRFRNTPDLHKIIRKIKKGEFCISGYYAEQITFISFDKDSKNIIKGLENLKDKDTEIVYMNIHYKYKRGYWIMKISNALKGGEKYESEHQRNR